MGIYDREYYRREGPSFLASFSERGKVCKWLIAVNVICFVIQMLTRQAQLVDLGGGMVGRVWESWFTELFVLDVAEVLNGQVWRLLTYAFLHSDSQLFHILFNMLFLWWFGSDVEDIYGPREFLAVYLVSALAGGVAYVAGSEMGLHRGGQCLGASGAVTAVMVLCALHYPTRIILLFFFLPVPIWLLVVFQVAQDLFGLLGGGGARNVAFSVHLAGAAFAFIYYKAHIRLTSFLPDLRGWLRQRSRPRLRVYREEDAAAPVSVAAPKTSAELDEHLEAKLDALLEKMARHGKESLTDSERQILLRASELYRRRRS